MIPGAGDGSAGVHNPYFGPWGGIGLRIRVRGSKTRFSGNRPGLINMVMVLTWGQSNLFRPWIFRLRLPLDPPTYPTAETMIFGPPLTHPRPPGTIPDQSWRIGVK